MTWRGLAALALTLTLCACGSNRAPAARSAEVQTPPLTAVLATASCPELRDRLFSFSSDKTVIDTHVWVEQCTARVEHDALTLVADAYAWMAVDRDFGAVGVRAFVHATVHAEVELQARAHYADGHLEVTLAPKPNSRIAVEPVGVLELAPLNWASLLAIEIAPAAGVSPEALAKAKMREEVERTLASSLTGRLSVVYDARHGTATLGSVASDGGAQQLRIAPHGTAFLGPFPASRAGSSIRMRIDAGRRVLVRPVCRTHARRILEADRRGDSIWAEDWLSAEGDARRDFDAMPCTWMLALRVSEEAAVVQVDAMHVEPAPPALDRPERWISIEEVSVEGEVPEPDVRFVVTNDRWRTTVFPRDGRKIRAMTILAPDEQLWLRAQRQDAGGLTTIAQAPLELDLPGDITTPIALSAIDGSRVATVKVRARVRQEKR